jgi:hypothetical protein
MNGARRYLGVADIGEILRLLPHRYPFLLTDRVIDNRGDQHGIGIKNLTVNEPFLARSARNCHGVAVIATNRIAGASRFLCRSTRPSFANQQAQATRGGFDESALALQQQCEIEHRIGVVGRDQ